MRGGWRWMEVCVGLLIAIAIGSPIAAAPPTSAPTSKFVRRRVVIIPSTQRATSPIPTFAIQEPLQKKIREIYALDYADPSFTARRNLARRLIDASNETRHDTDAKYVLLIEARDLAAAVGDVTTAFDAVDGLVKSFPLSKLTERIAVLQSVMPALSTVPANLAASSMCMDLMDQCLVEGDYDRAETVHSLAAIGARAAKSVPYARWIERRGALLRPLKEAYETARPAEAELAHTPEDPSANLIMGKFVAFIRGDFDAGLTMLEKSGENPFALAAKADLDSPDTSTAQFLLAGMWWDLAEGLPSEYATAIRRRAGFWYRKATASLDGLDKALAERRLQSLNAPVTPGIKKSVERPPDALMLLPGRWYRISIAEVNWETAQRLAQEAGGKLVSIETRAEGDLITKLARGRLLWLGASVDETGKWKWISGSELLYTNWSSGEPRNLSIEAHPITTPAGGWQSATGKAGFICEWQ